VSDLIVGIVVNVLREVLLQGLQLFGVLRISTSARDFAVLNSSELVVLDLEVSFPEFPRLRRTAEEPRRLC
jgi:hypothetical protein